MKKISLTFFLMLFLSCASLPRRVNTFTFISERGEYYIGKVASAQLLYNYPLLKNDSLTEYLTTLANYLAIFSERPYIYKGYHVGVLNTEEPMAFSTPGGFIFISKGLIEKLDNEDQLAAVIAHELGHIAKRHGLLYIETSYLIDFSTKLVKKIGYRKLKDRRKRKIAEISADIVNFLIKRGYSRKQEEEADREAVHILKESGYNPDDLVEVLKKLEEYSKHGLVKIQFMKTHPFPEKRIKILKPIVFSKNVPEKRTKRFLLYKNML